MTMHFHVANPIPTLSPNILSPDADLSNTGASLKHTTSSLGIFA